MKIISVVLEYRFYKLSDEEVYTEASFDYEFWKRYLMVFDQVRIIARAKEVTREEINSKWKIVTGKNVSFIPIPYYHGMGQLARRFFDIARAVKGIAKKNEDSVYIFRLPSIIASIFFLFNRNIRVVRYGIEMVGDPEEVFASLGFQYRILGNLFVRHTKKIISSTSSAAYVERVILPRKYPASRVKRSYYFSSINLADGDILQGKDTFLLKDNRIQIASIGSLDQMYKGPDLLLKALSICKQQGLNFELRWIGGGKYMSDMITLAKQLGMENEVRFEGIIADRNAINEILDTSDLFVLASRTEGLPRAMIEAMARGLPAIGARVGGIPELLSDEYLFEKGDFEKLAEIILTLYKDKDSLRKMSKENIEVAKRYLNSNLNREREGFYKALLDCEK